MKNQQNRHAPKLKLRKGDLVKVISGNSKGKEGKINSILVHSNRALVEGVNVVSKHTKPNAKNTQGGIVKQEATIHISNLMLIDPSKKVPTRVGRRIENGKIMRYAKKSNELIKDVK